MITSQDISYFIEAFSRVATQLPGSANAPLREMRSAAMDRFSAQGFPTRAQEAWKYTRLHALQNQVFHEKQKSTASTDTRALENFIDRSLGKHILVFVNGFFSSTLSQVSSLPAGAVIENLAVSLEKSLSPVLGQVLEKNHAFAALNTAFMSEGLYLHLPPNVVLDEPIQLIYITTENEISLHPRNLIVLGDNSQVTLVESYVSVSSSTYFNNCVTEVKLGENAVFEHVKIQQESEKAFHLATQYVEQCRGSQFISQMFSLGGALARNEIHVRLKEEKTTCSLKGLYVAKGEQQLDQLTFINHAHPNTHSTELYKGIVKDQARAIFNGHILVQKGAQKTSAHLTNQNLLLSKQAEVNTKPLLEIYADDVQCSHGATIGQLDEEALFYLRSRGVDAQAAEVVLAQAFARELIEQVKLKKVREKLHRALFAEQEPRA